MLNTLVYQVDLVNHAKHMTDKHKISSSIESVVSLIHLVHHCRILGRNKRLELRTLDIVIKRTTGFRFRKHRQHFFHCVVFLVKRHEQFQSLFKVSMLVYFHVFFRVNHVEVCKN